MTLPEFRNEPLTDFSDEANAEAFREAIRKVEGRLAETWPLVIGGERIETPETFESIDPSDPSRVVGRFAEGGAQEAARAVEAAWSAFETWSETSFQERAELLQRIAARMRERKHEISAWMVIEVGKTWVEADADTAEAIDFCDYYAQQMLRLGPPQDVAQTPGETSELFYLPLGVGAVIPPWNFPAAILTGMTVGPVVAGNTVVLKPSSDSAGIAHACFSLFEEAGMPPGVVNLVTGPGSSAGRALVDHPKTRFITFTGSKEVGLEIYERAARVHEGQIWLKRVVAEMGGKDAIIVDETADLDEAAAGIVASAFGFQGQKCSACSRAILVGEIHDPLLDRIVARTEDLRLGDPRRRDTHVGPVINESQRDKIAGYMDLAAQEGQVLCGGGRAEQAGAGWYLQPTVVSGVSPDARIAQEEIFGPVLAVIRAQDWDDALRIANDTEYGLTGAVYSSDEERLEEARRRFHVGNLYLNRKCTGALVGVHPFGGFNMSGTDAKAGGRDYLLYFLQAKSVSRKE